VEAGLDLARAAAELLRPRLPVGAKPLGRDVLLGLPRFQRRHLGGAAAGLAALGHALLDLRPAGREGPDDLLGHARDLGGAFARLLELQSQAPGELVTKLCLVQVASGLGVA